MNQLAIPYSVFNTILDYCSDKRDEELSHQLNQTFLTPVPSSDIYFDNDALIRFTQAVNLVDSYRPMFEASRKAILENVSGNDHVILVGPDLMEMDVLPHLLSRYKKVTLIGISLRSFDFCLKVIKDSQKEQVRCLKIDLTQCYRLTEATLCEVYQERLSKEEALNRLIAIVQNAAKRKIHRQLKADYIVCSLVIGQLDSLFIEHFGRVLIKFFGNSIVPHPKFQKWKRETESIFQLKGLHNLHSWVKQNGRIYFADTVQNMTTGKQVLKPTTLERMEKIFETIHKPKEIYWNSFLSIPRVFKIQQWTLSPKPIKLPTIPIEHDVPEYTFMDGMKDLAFIVKSYIFNRFYI